MKHLANHRDQHACSANEIAEEYGISATLMAKVLQKYYAGLTAEQNVKVELKGHSAK